jgi:2-(3-amino-3-carboxypropyl)histidine synthase
MKDKIIEIIKREKAKNVLLQFPDGLKKKATKIAKEIEKNTNAEVFIWLNSCYGACDIPLLGKLEKKIDVVFSFGHSLWPFQKKIKAMEI